MLKSITSWKGLEVKIGLVERVDEDANYTSLSPGTWISLNLNHKEYFVNCLLYG